MSNTLTTIEKRTFEETYLDYVNNFLTISYMAEFYGVDETYLANIIELGKINNRYNNFCKIAKNWKR